MVLKTEPSQAKSGMLNLQLWTHGKIGNHIIVISLQRLPKHDEAVLIVDQILTDAYQPI
jgi:hypothetical protein